ncbi:MAG: sulfite exporter TauE/SafE family protein [Magnetococcus sp. YQC-5]
MSSSLIELWLIFLAALLGSGHCIGMCGGVAASCSLGLAPSVGGSWWRSDRVTLPLLYSVGRVGGYVVLGALTGWIGSMVLFYARPLHLNGVPHLVVGIFMLLVGLRTMGLFSSPEGSVIPAGWLSGWSRFFTPANPSQRALGMGVMTALLPCHLHWAFQAKALAAGSVMGGMGILFAFGLGTLPALWSFALLSSWLDCRARRRIVQITGLLIVWLGVSSLQRAVMELFDSHGLFSHMHH